MAPFPLARDRRNADCIPPLVPAKGKRHPLVALGRRARDRSARPPAPRRADRHRRRGRRGDLAAPHRQRAAGEHARHARTSDRHRHRRRLHGHHDGVARHRAPLSRPRHPRVAVAAAARRADLHHGLYLRGSLRLGRPRADGPARCHGLEVPERLLVSGNPLASRLHPRDVRRALSLHLHRRAGDVPDAERKHAGSGAHARRQPHQALPHHCATPRPPCPGRGRVAGAARSAQRHRRQ